MTAGTATADTAGVVTVEEVKRELRTEDYSGHDDTVEAQIAAAAAFVGGEIGVPLADAHSTVRARPETGNRPIVFDARGLKRVDRVRYWTPAAELRDDPDGAIEAAEFGRTVRAGRLGRGHGLYPPAAGWPDVLPGSLLDVEVVRGVDAGDLPALKQAVIMCVRQLYGGHREIRPTEAFYALIAPWQPL
ncbi:hypothetical protein [Candidatus Palauibacter sp.]|uniref:hypothetical protein n=1 Tax=Candidatus Palauibacter sp. TaxID=3101350 RepID=UPI003CC6C810